MTDQATTQSLVVEREVPHPPEKVWRALTQSPLMEDWLMHNDFKPVVGHRFTLRSQPAGGWDGVIDCEVLVVEPQARLAYSWNSMGLESVVTFTLKPTPAGAQLRMEQSGFRSDQRANLQGATYGWKNFMDSLERVLGELK